MHSYAGLYAWAVHHRLTGWQALSWPAEIDVFLAVGELALYVAYLDGWAAKQRIWPWVTALVGLAVSVAGNVGHIQAAPAQPVLLADRLTAAASPLAAFAGLTVGLLVLRMNRHYDPERTSAGRAAAVPPPLATGAAAGGNGHRAPAAAGVLVPGSVAVQDQMLSHASNSACPARWPDTSDPDPAVLRAAGALAQSAAERGERLSQRALARRLRGNGHRFANQQLHRIAMASRADPPQQSSPHGR